MPYKVRIKFAVIRYTPFQKKKKNTPVLRTFSPSTGNYQCHYVGDACRRTENCHYLVYYFLEPSIIVEATHVMETAHEGTMFS